MFGIGPLVDPTLHHTPSPHTHTLPTHTHPPHTHPPHTHPPHRSPTLGYNTRPSRNVFVGLTDRSHLENSWRNMLSMELVMQSYASEYNTTLPRLPSCSMRSPSEGKGSLRHKHPLKASSVGPQRIVLASISIDIIIFNALVVIQNRKALRISLVPSPHVLPSENCLVNKVEFLGQKW